MVSQNLPQHQQNENISNIMSIKPDIELLKQEFFDKYWEKFDFFMFIENTQVKMIEKYCEIKSLIESDPEALQLELSSFNRSLNDNTKSILLSVTNRLNRILPEGKNSD